MNSDRDENVADLCGALVGQHEALDEIVAKLTVTEWARPTPAIGWDVRDTIHHLAYFDEVATSVVRHPDAFVEAKPAILADPDAYMDAHVVLGRSSSGVEVLRHWRTVRRVMVEVFEGVHPARRVPWFGPDMSGRSFITARLMEAFAHGQDVADAFGLPTPSVAGLYHIAHLGVITRGFSYAIRGRTTPRAAVRVELVGPLGERWTWGSPLDTDTVCGPALDFCLVVTQRRHAADSALVAHGTAAHEWLEIAQAFAGPPGPGRRAGQFREG